MTVSATAICTYALLRGPSIIDPGLVAILAATSSVAAVVGARVKRGQDPRRLGVYMAVAYTVAGVFIFHALGWFVVAVLGVAPLVAQAVIARRISALRVKLRATHLHWNSRTAWIGVSAAVAAVAGGVASALHPVPGVQTAAYTAAVVPPAVAMWRMQYGAIHLAEALPIARPRRWL